MSAGDGDDETAVAVAAETEAEAEARRRMVLVPVAIAGGQLGVGLLTVAIGGVYDYLGSTPGWIVVAGLVLMGGPGIVWALIQARSILAGGGLVNIAAPGKERGEKEQQRR